MSLSASGWIEPCKAVLVKEPPAGSDWIHEIKHDGYRVIAVISAGRAHLHPAWSRLVISHAEHSGGA
jgi:ATP-dependent DNA ligase